MIGVDVHQRARPPTRKWYVPLENIAETEIKDRSVLLRLAGGLGGVRDVPCGPEAEHLHYLITQAQLLLNVVEDDGL